MSLKKEFENKISVCYLCFRCRLCENFRPMFVNVRKLFILGQQRCTTSYVEIFLKNRPTLFEEKLNWLGD